MRYAGLERSMMRHSAFRATIRSPLIVGTALALLVASLFVAPVLGIGASPASQAAPLPSLEGASTGSYGNITNVTFNGTAFGGVYYGSASYGYVVNQTTTNVSANLTEVHYEETIGIYFHLEFCRANCSAPVDTANITYVASEVRDSWANLTNTASVTVYNGSAHYDGANQTGKVEAAIGLINATTRSRSHDSEAAYVTADLTTNASYWVRANASYASNSSVAFTPALGLYPIENLTTGEFWSSTAAYDLAGTWAAQWSINVSLPHISGSSTGTVGGTLGPFFGNVTLTGHNGPAWAHVDANRAGVVQFRLSTRNLVMIGPYVIDGEASANAWGQGWGGMWSSVAFAGARTSLGPTYLLISTGGIIRSPMSGVSFSAGATDASGVSGFSDSGLAPQTENAHPMSASSAASTAACLETGSCSTGGTSSAPLSLLGNATLAWVVIGVVATAIALGAVVFVLRRRP